VLVTGVGLALVYPEQFTYKRLPLIDFPNMDIDKFFEPAFSFIDSAIFGDGKVLVHCAAGVSRSATIVIGYIMFKSRIPYQTALEQVKSKRPIVKPNDGFVKQLQEFEAREFSFKKPEES
jgi:protein-tyrosine phosphatase